MSVPSRGSRGVIARTQHWYSPNNDEGSFVPVVSAETPFDPALLDDDWDLDGQERPTAYGYNFGSLETGAEYVPLPDLTVATVDQDAGLWQEQPGQEASLAPRWFAPDAEQAPPLLPPLFTIDPATLDDDTDDDAQQYRDLTRRWFQPDTEAWTPLPNLTVAAIDQQPLYGEEQQQLLPTTQRWFAPDASAEPPAYPTLPAPSFDPTLLPLGNGDETQQLRAFGHATAPTWETGGERYVIPTLPQVTDLLATSELLRTALTWTDPIPPSGFTGFAGVKIYRSENGGPFFEVGTAGPGSGVYTPDLWGTSDPFLVDITAATLVYRVTPYTSDGSLGAPAVSNAVGLMWLPAHEQPPLPSTAQRWFAPDQEWAPTATGDGPAPPSVNVEQFAGLWPEQPGQERSNAQRWFAPDPHSGPTAAPLCFADTVLADAPEAWWRLGESAGTTAVDQMAAHDGTYTGTYTLGATGLLSGDSNTALDTGSSTGYVTVPASAALNLLTNFSLEAWFQWDGSTPTNYVLLVLGDASTESKPALLVYPTTGYLSLAASDSGIIEVQYQSALGAGTHHVIVTYGAGPGTGKMYLDGVDVGTLGAGTTFSGATPEQVQIGAEVGANIWDGRIQDVAIYNYVLTSAQVAAHYAARTVSCPPEPPAAPPTTEQLAGLWREQQGQEQRPVPWLFADNLLGITATEAFDPTVIDFGYDAQQNRSTAVRWFAPDEHAAGFVPLGSAAAPRVDGDFGYDAQQDRSTAQRWFAPDIEVSVLRPLSFVTTATVPEQAPLWIEQPYPLAGNRQRWYDPSVEPVPGPLKDTLFTTPPAAGFPTVLIDASTGDVYLYIGSNFIVPAS